jgi:hypothetical protein
LFSMNFFKERGNSLHCLTHSFLLIKVALSDCHTFFRPFTNYR